eukprot:372479-Rhodomonas_salina.1
MAPKLLASWSRTAQPRREVQNVSLTSTGMKYRRTGQRNVLTRALARRCCSSHARQDACVNLHHAMLSTYESTGIFVLSHTAPTSTVHREILYQSTETVPSSRFFVRTKGHAATFFVFARKRSGRFRDRDQLDPSESVCLDVAVARSALPVAQARLQVGAPGGSGSLSLSLRLSEEALSLSLRKCGSSA